MRSLTAVILLTAFFALQYGKLISYWHCKLATIGSAAPCDCVKQLLDVHKDGTSHTAATLKEKTEEIVLFHEQPLAWQPLPAAITHTIAYIPSLPVAHSCFVFQPPQL